MNTEVLFLMKRLEKHPNIKARLLVLLDAAENVSGDLELANDAEDKIYNEVIRMGNDTLTAWAISQEAKKIVLPSSMVKKNSLANPIRANKNSRTTVS